VVGNVCNSRARIARGLRVEPAAVVDRVAASIDGIVPPRVVPHGPCQAVAVDAPDLAVLPVPKFFAHESGRYVTAGAVVARSLETGAANLSVARLKLLGGNRVMIGIAPNHHLAALAREAAARGQTLPIAVTIGHHPAVLVAACLYLALGDDELGHAGWLLGEPVEVVRLGHGDLAVPAHSEIVLEATLDPRERVEEGLVSEYHGMYESYGAGYVATVHRLTRREDAIFQVIANGHYPEHILLGGVAIGGGLTAAVRRVVPGVREVVLPEGGSGRLSCVVAIDDPRPGDARTAMFAIWAAVSIVKQVTVVDADVDPWDADRVEWARTCFARPERDLVIVPYGRSDRSVPLAREGTVTKLGIDATRKPGDRGDWRVAGVVRGRG
jgi:4-hydroxy-3-polyprenylbenzoate decarboxylase